MKTIELRLEDPVDDPINKKRGLYGHPRKGGRTHKGLDYLSSKGTPVKASEDGRVVKVDFKNGVGSYGNTVVIDHTPKAKDNERHIYTLYAHLEKGSSVKNGKEVKQGDVIGKSGNTGTTEYYDYLAGKRRTEGGFHLHFEVIDTIDSKRALDWSKGKWPSGHRKDPMDGYLGSTKTIEYPLTDEEMSMIQDRLDIDPVIDFKRGIYRFDAYLGGKKIGYFDKHTKEIRLSLSPEELEEILRKPPDPSGKEPRVYEVNIG
jgi:murein DD-endopeptidase MepM/ murein hydrolase activator NlpD